ncbi:MAG: BPTI/Kunitz-type proteinase inhibitor domain-containing protein [Sulfurimonadaceae bacterium]
MMIRLLLTAALFILNGCSTMGLNSDSIGVETKEYGQCIVNTKASPSFNKKKVTFICQEDRVLLGEAYQKDGEDVIDSALLQKKGEKYLIKDRSEATVVRGLHSVCQLEPLKGNGNQSLKGYYFDRKLKECRPFTWSGKGGFVPFTSADACEQYCKH